MSSDLNNNLKIVSMKTKLTDARHTQTVEENEQGESDFYCGKLSFGIAELCKNQCSKCCRIEEIT